MALLKSLTGEEKLDLGKGRYNAVFTGLASNGSQISPMKRTTKGAIKYAKAVYANVVDVFDAE